MLTRVETARKEMQHIGDFDYGRSCTHSASSMRLSCISDAVPPTMRVGGFSHLYKIEAPALCVLCWGLSLPFDSHPALCSGGEQRREAGGGCGADQHHHHSREAAVQQDPLAGC